MELVGERLILRPWHDEDAPELYRYAKDPRVGPRAGWAPHTSVENSLEIIRGVLSEPETYAVVFKETGKPIGSVGIMTEGRGSGCVGPGEAEIGYWLAVPYWGRGLIPEAVELLLRRCFTQLSCTRVWCAYHDGNDKSRRVQEKCGFTYHHSDVREDASAPRVCHFTCQTKEDWEGKNDFRPGIYRHFKGGEYELLYLATTSETRGDVVVYRALYGECGVWVRPKKMWNETLEHDGKPVRRFTYICSRREREGT